jgi:hypothetical protein
VEGNPVGPSSTSSSSSSSEATDELVIGGNSDLNTADLSGYEFKIPLIDGISGISDFSGVGIQKSCCKYIYLCERIE